MAENVDDLVRDPAVMRNFRQQNGEFIRRKKAYEDAVRARQKEINKHCQKIINDKRLRDRKAGPPEKGMQWREEHSDDHDDPVEGWFPPATIEVPPNPWFYEPGNTADLTPEYMRPAQYLLLSLCHDYCLEHRRKIITEEGFYLDLVKNREGIESFLRQYEKHLKPAYKDIISDLEEILEEKGKQTPFPQAEREAKRGRKSKYSLEKVKQIQKSYQDYRKEKKSAKSAWHLAAKDHKIITGAAAKMACRRYLPQNK